MRVKGKSKGNDKDNGKGYHRAGEAGLDGRDATKKHPHEPRVYTCKGNDGKDETREMSQFLVLSVDVTS